MSGIDVQTIQKDGRTVISLDRRDYADPVVKFLLRRLKQSPKPPAAPSSQPEHVSDAKGKPCKPGQSAERTGCIPAKDDQQQQAGPKTERREPGNTWGGVASDASRATAELTELGKQVLSGVVEIEHGAKDFIVRQVEKLPTAIQYPVVAVFKALYGTYVQSAKAVDAVATEQGWNEEQKARITAAVCTADAILGMKVMPAILAASGFGAVASAASSFIPLASLAYLGTSAFATPLAVLRAAKKKVDSLLAQEEHQKAILNYREKLFSYYYAKSGKCPRGNGQCIADDVPPKLPDDDPDNAYRAMAVDIGKRMEQTNDPESWLASFSAALDKVQDLNAAMDVADQATADMPAGKVKKDMLPGGLADDKPDSDFDPEQLAAGIAVELEHTDDEDLAREIAKDHLTEDPEYYVKLRRMEQKGYVYKESYFENCPRDEQGHCKPKGEGDESGQQHHEGRQVPRGLRGTILNLLAANPGMSVDDIERLHPDSMEAVRELEASGKLHRSGDMVKLGPPKLSPIAGQRKVTLDVLKPYLGDKAETAAKLIGLNLGIYSLIHNIRKGSDMAISESQAREIAKELGEKVTAYLKERGMPAPHPKFMALRTEFTESDAERDRRLKIQDEEFKRKKKQKIAEAKAYAEEHWKKPPVPQNVNQKTWIAIKMKQEMAAIEKDLPKLEYVAKLYRDLDWQVDRLRNSSPDNWQEIMKDRDAARDAYDKEMERPSTKARIARYKNYWMDKKDQQTPEGALSVAKEKREYMGAAWNKEEGELFSDYSQIGAKAAVEYKEAVKEAFKNPDYKPSKEILEQFRYEDWLPQKYRDREDTARFQRMHSEYMKNEFQYALGHLNAAMERAKPQLDKLMERVESYPKEAKANVDKLWQDAFDADATRKMLFNAVQDFERQYKVPAPAPAGWASTDPSAKISYAIVIPPEKNEIYDAMNADLVKATDDTFAKTAIAQKAQVLLNEKWLEQILPKEGNDTADIPDMKFLKDQTQLTKANEFLRKVVAKNWGPLDVDVEQLPLGYYRANESHGHIRVSPNVSADVLIHEFGHYLEEQDSDTLAMLSKAFAMKQLLKKKQKPQQLGSQYEPTEIGAKDDFLDAYVGKFYPQAASEVLSMGVQQLYNDPFKFLAESPDHFRYTLACLHGMLTR